MKRQYNLTELRHLQRKKGQSGYRDERKRENDLRIRQILDQNAPAQAYPNKR